MQKLPPLHLAVIQENLPLVKLLACQRDRIDNYGFTAEDIANFLGKKQCLRLLSRGEERGEKEVKIVWPNHSVLQRYSPEELGEKIGISWCSHLLFPSYRSLVAAVRRFPLLMRVRWLFPECYQLEEEDCKALMEGAVADVTIVWVDERWGFGLVSNRDLQEGDWVGAYTGMVRPIPLWHPDPNGYCLRYPTWWIEMRTYVIDSQKYGNATRFVNHSENPNLAFSCLVYKRLLHFVLRAARFIPRGTMLTMDYGSDYWRRRRLNPNVVKIT